MTITVKPIENQAQADNLAKLLYKNGIFREENYFLQCFNEYKKGNREFFIASQDNKIIGYCFLNYKPKYPLFKKLGIAEIQDILVLPEYRRKGTATNLIKYCEDFARKRNMSQIGISVGVSSEFGTAQILYAKLGYIPDGNGVSYDRESVKNGEFRPVDENLCLMMIKQL